MRIQPPSHRSRPLGPLGTFRESCMPSPLASLCHATSPPFILATSPKCVDRESREGRRTGTRERKGTSPEMFVVAVRGRAIKCGNKKKSEKKKEKNQNRKENIKTINDY